MKNNFLDTEAVLNKEFFETIKEMVVCVICTGVIIDPKQCSNCENTFCKMCISDWLKTGNTCPFKCVQFSVKEPSRTVKNLIEKLSFKCPLDCSLKVDMNYDTVCKHFNDCEKLKSECPTCGTLVLKNHIKENKEILKLKKRLLTMEEENFKLMQEKNEFANEIRRFNEREKEREFQREKDKEKPHNKSPSANNFNMIRDRPSDESELGLIDKCDHFKGNYKPIFLCCNKAFACYICHSEKQDHAYEFSNRVVCLLCNNIYTGSKCTQCNAYQIYRKK